MNTVELTDKELGYLYNLASRVIAKGGRTDLADETAFQKLYEAAERAGLKEPADMSEFMFNGHGLYRVDGPTR